MEIKREKNIAFIDAQNLHFGTMTENWKISFKKFRIYLKDKFKANKVYYFLGYFDEKEEDLYENLKNNGYEVIFREHSFKMKGKKKGNVDVDICFEMMKNIADNKDFDKIILISGDGDYIKPVKYFIEKGRFKKILFPNGKYSSLYRNIQDNYSINLSTKDIRERIEYKN